MFDTYKMQEVICKELEKKAESGLRSTSDLDTVWKLIDAYKNLLKIDMFQEAGEYSQGDGYSERRQRRDNRGRYSREGGSSYEGGNSYGGNSYEGNSYRGSSGYSEARGEYMEAKQSYRSNRSPESKRGMNVSLQECMSKLKEELDEMEANADTREERDKIREMRREIGKLA